MKYLAKLLLCFCLSTTAALAASYDCSKATTLTEQAICANSTLSNLDGTLFETYKNALVTAPDATALKTEQRRWISETRDKCTTSSCLMQVYTDRIAVLKNQKTSSGVSSEALVYTGTYKNKLGQLDVQQLSGNRLKFELYSSHGTGGSTNIGQVDDEVTVNGPSAIYEKREDDCRIAFLFAPTTVDVKQIGTCGMGMGVNGTGTYKITSRKPPKFNE